MDVCGPFILLMVYFFSLFLAITKSWIFTVTQNESIVEYQICVLSLPSSLDVSAKLAQLLPSRQSLHTYFSSNSLQSTARPLEFCPGHPQVPI